MNLKHGTEFIIETNKSLATNKDGINIHEHRKQQKE